MRPRTGVLAASVLAAASALLAARSSQEPAAVEDWPVLDLQRVRYDEARHQSVMLELHEVRAHLVQNRPDFRFSALFSFELEPVKEVYVAVGAPSVAGLDLLWERDDPQLARLLQELLALASEQDNVFLRQVAGVRREGQDLFTRAIVRWKVRARIGKLGQALETARELTEHVNASDRTVEARAYVEYFGRAGTIWWFFEVSGPAGWEAAERRLHADPVFLEILDRGADAFVDDSFDDRWLGRI